MGRPRKHKTEPIIAPEGGYAGSLPVYTAEERAEVVRLAEAGRSCREISNVTGMSTGWVSMLVHAAGLRFPEEKRTAAATAARVRNQRMARLDLIERQQMALEVAIARYQLHVLDSPHDLYGQALRAREVREISAAVESVARVDARAGEWYADELAGDTLEAFSVQIRIAGETGPYTVSLDMVTGKATWKDRDKEIIHVDTVPLPASPGRPELEAAPTIPAGIDPLASLPPYDGPRLDGEQGETDDESS